MIHMMQIDSLGDGRLDSQRQSLELKAAVGGPGLLAAAAFSAVRGEELSGDATVCNATADDRRISLRPAPRLTVHSGEVMPDNGLHGLHEHGSDITSRRGSALIHSSISRVPGLRRPR